MAPRTKVEKRMDADAGVKYTQEEFIDYYGKKQGAKKWDAAGGAAAPVKGKAAAGNVKYDFSGLEKGMRVQVEQQGVWYAADVVSVAKGKKDAPVKVHYAGDEWNEWDESVGGDRIRSKALIKGEAPAAAAPTSGGYDYSALEKGMRIKAELQGVWYAAEVVTVAKSEKRAKAPVMVHFPGYDGCDEWVGADRIRSKAVKEAAVVPAKAAAASTTGTYDYSGLEKGMRIQVEMNGTWYAADVVTIAKAQKKAKAPVKVNFPGWGADSDEWVGGDCIRSKALGKPAAQKAAAPPASTYDFSGLEKGMRLQVELDGTWYAANVVMVKKGYDKVKVNFAGWDAANDEWVGSDRIRSKALVEKAAAPAQKGATTAKKAAAPAASKYDYSGLEKGMRLQVEVQGTWYAAEVVTVATAKTKAKAPVKVHFSGSGVEPDVWVGGDRIRSKALTTEK